ncbi:MAG: hypothetical protein ACXWYJ_09930 [Actinomycetota bacterium]
MKGIRVVVAFMLVAGAQLGAGAVAGAQPSSPVPGTTCTVFPADNAWHLNVSRMPVHRRNDVWKKAMHAGGTDLHPDFGPPSYGIPYDVVGGGHAKVSVDFTYASESDPGPYPFGPDITVEGGSDRHAMMIDQSECTLYELFAATWNGGNPTAGSGAIFDLGSNALRPRGWTSADAAGLSIFAGLLRWDEVQAGEVDHAIRFTVDCTSRSFLWPARHQAGSSDRRCPPMGARFRLKRGFSLAGFSDDAKVILRGMKRYGLMLADNGSDWYFQGTVDPGWTNGLLDQMKTIPAGAFVAVDISGCQVAKNSGAFVYGPDCPAP